MEATELSTNLCPPIHEGTAVINGVELPERVIEELRRLGIALSWYSHGELEAAVNACAYDGQLIDDPDGVDFMDELELTPHEEKEENGEIEAFPARHQLLHVKPFHIMQGFAEKVAANNDDDDSARLCA